MDIADLCAIIFSALSLIISLYNVIVQNLSKISVNIRFIRGVKHHEDGDSLNHFAIFI